MTTRLPSGSAAPVEPIPLEADTPFDFECRRDLACFTRCCSDVKILLTPVDVLRLARRTGLSTTDFLAAHTIKPITKELHLPVVMLKLEGAEKRCPFVSAQGCSIYDDRQWACHFSSRGPTSDGRPKPDLLAPGEKIFSAVPPEGRTRSKTARRKRRATERVRPKGSYKLYDGTTMAAAHVAGAIAAILSVRPDLVGHPDQVKKLLLESATDLGRDRYFQGRGFLNLSRALDEHVLIEPENTPIQKASDIEASASPAAIHPVGLDSSAPVGAEGNTKRFAVAFSYAGEQNEYVERVWKALRQFGRLPRRSIFYHKRFVGELSRPNLDVYQPTIRGRPPPPPRRPRWDG